MSTLIGWASGVFGARRGRRVGGPWHNWARRPYGFELLESRRMLAVTATYSAGMLTISVDDASSITITSSAPGLGGNVLVNGLDPTGGPALSSAVTDIQLSATNNFDNLIDLTQVAVVDFSALANMSLNAGDGSDTYLLNQNGFAFGATVDVSDTGASGTDTLQLGSTSVASETIGVSSTAVTRTASATVTYGGIEALQVNATVAADTINVANTAAGTATIINAYGGKDTFGDIDLTTIGLAGLTIDADGGAVEELVLNVTLAGTIAVSNTAVQRSGNGAVNYSGFEKLTINGSAGADTFNIASTAVGAATTIFGAGDVDVFNVNDLSAIGSPGAVGLNGGGNGDMLNVQAGAPVEGTVFVGSILLLQGVHGSIVYTGFGNLNIKGTAGADTFMVGSTNAGTATSLDGLGSGDTYNVVQSALGGTLTITDTGASGTDTISSTTAFAGPETITITSASITRSGGEPAINYTGIEALSVNGTAGVDTFNVNSTPGATSLDGLGSGDTYNVVQSALGGTLTITDTGASGTDTISSTTAFAEPETITITSASITRSGGEPAINYTGIEALSVNGTPAGDIVNVVSTPGDTVVNAGAGNDTINVGNAGSLASIVGALTLHGDGHSGTPTNTLTSGVVSNTLPVGDTVHFDDSAAAGAINYTLGSGTLARTGITTISFDTFETIVLDAGTGGNTIDVSGTLASVNVTVNGGAGSDTITLVSNGVTSNVVLNGGADADTMTIQSVAAGSVVIANGNSEVDIFTPIDLTTIAATAGLTVDADGGAGELLTLNVATNGTVSVSSTTVQRSGNGAVTYSDFELLTINGTAGADTFNVASTAAGTATTINAAGSTDLFGPIALTTIGAAGLTIDANGGAGEALTLETTATGTVTLTSTTAQRTGNGLLTYTDFELLTLNGTAGVDLVNVLSTIATTAYVVNAGGSNDMITLGIAGTLSGILGAITVHGDAHSAVPTNTLNSGSVSNTLPVGDTLRFDDSTAGGAVNYTLNPGTLARTGAATITFDTVETIVLDAGTNGNFIDVTGTAASVNVTVNGGAGVDVITLAGTGATSNVVLNGGADNDILNILAVATGSVVFAGGNADNDTINVSSDAPANAGSLNGILGGLRVDTGTGADKLILSDLAATVANSAVEVRNNRINGFAGPTSAAQVDYVFGGTLELTLIGSNTLDDKFRVFLPSLPGLTMRFDGAGGADDDLRIDGTASDDIISVGVFGSGQAFQVQNIECLKLFGGAGNDTITNATAVSSLIDGGAGDDILSGGSATDVIFGGDGIDQLFGNAGNDYLFADHEYNNGSPVAGPTRNDDQIFGGTGIDTIVSLGSDTISAGGDVGDTIIGTGFRITVVDWLKARFLKPEGKNVQNAINQAMAQHCAQP